MATLTQWLNDTWKHLTFDDEMVGKNGSVIKIPEINIELTSGLFSTDDLEEFKEIKVVTPGVDTLKQQLDEAIQKEDYEKAAELRDQLKEMGYQ